MQQAPYSTQVLVSKEATCLGSLEGSKSRAKLNVKGDLAVLCSVRKKSIAVNSGCHLHCLGT